MALDKAIEHGKKRRINIARACRMMKRCGEKWGVYRKWRETDADGNTISKVLYIRRKYLLTRERLVVKPCDE